MGRGEKAKLSLLFLPITPRSRSTLVPIIPLSRFSRAREFPFPHLALGKPVEEAGPDRELTENERDFLLLLSRLVSGCLDPSFSRRCKNKMSNFFLSDRKGSQANSRKRQVNSSKVRLQVLTEM